MSCWTAFCGVVGGARNHRVVSRARQRGVARLCAVLDGGSARFWRARLEEFRGSRGVKAHALQGRHGARLVFEGESRGFGRARIAWFWGVGVLLCVYAHAGSTLFRPLRTVPRRA